MLICSYAVLPLDSTAALLPGGYPGATRCGHMLATATSAPVFDLGAAVMAVHHWCSTYEVDMQVRIESLYNEQAVQTSDGASGGIPPQNNLRPQCCMGPLVKVSTQVCCSRWFINFAR